MKGWQRFLIGVAGFVGAQVMLVWFYWGQYAFIPGLVGLGVGVWLFVWLGTIGKTPRPRGRGV